MTDTTTFADRLEQLLPYAYEIRNQGGRIHAATSLDSTTITPVTGYADALEDTAGIIMRTIPVRSIDEILPGRRTIAVRADNTVTAGSFDTRQPGVPGAFDGAFTILHIDHGIRLENTIRGVKHVNDPWGVLEHSKDKAADLWRVREHDGEHHEAVIIIADGWR